MNIVWTKPNGGVAITHLLPEIISRIERAKGISAIPEKERHLDDQFELDFVRKNIGLTSEDHATILKRREQKDFDTGKINFRPEILDFTPVAYDADIPSDRTFRNAWEYTP